MKFFVLGCNGMAGHLISLYLKEQGHEVVGFDRREPQYVSGITGDAHDIDKLCQVILDGKFDTVINCVGILNQFAENNPHEAEYLNAKFPHLLVDITAGTKTQVIHMSTDCVFSGKKGKYTEQDVKDGDSVYDCTKALGELDDNKNLTLRNSIVGPDINPNGIGLLNWFMQQRGTVNGYIRAIWTGQTTLQLAKTMEVAAREKVHGLYNMVPEGSICKYDLLKLFNHYLRGDSVIINPVDGVALDKSLVRTNFNFDYIIPDYEKMVAELADWIKAHKDMYVHYGL